jgi:CheY-like chemotaxis protein
VVREVVKEVPVEVVREVEKPVPFEVVREVPVEVVREVEVIKEIVKEVPVEVIREVVREVPVEVVKEVPVEVVREVEVIKEIVKEVPVEVIREVVREVPVEVVKEVPVEVVREVEVIREILKEVPVEIIREVVREVPVELVREMAPPVDGAGQPPQRPADETVVGGAEAERERQRVEAAAVPAGPHLLVVDDDEAVRTTLSEVLAGAGYAVALAASGLEGIAKVRERGHPFDLVVTDLGMPDVPGWEVVEAVKQLDATTPVVIISGFDRQRAARRARELRVELVISKPFELDEVVSSVRNLLASRQRS